MNVIEHFSKVKAVCDLVAFILSLFSLFISNCEMTNLAVLKAFSCLLK